MGMINFFNKATKSCEKHTAYYLGNQLGVKHTGVMHWLGQTKRPEGKGFAFTTLKRLRQLSGMSWSEFGKIIDDEF